VTVVTYSDFLCPFCRSLALGIEDFLPKSGDRLNLYFKNYPLEQSCNAKLSRTVHPGACVMALGGICANEQGKFWAYHDKVFAGPPTNPGAADVERIGQQAGLDPAALAVCLSSQGAKDKLARQIADATAAGVEATPTIFINGKKLPRVNDFIQVVVDEAAKHGIPPPTPPPAAPSH
jgi:protein-disulfide isomerase